MVCTYWRVASGKFVVGGQAEPEAGGARGCLRQLIRENADGFPEARFAEVILAMD